MPDTSVPMDYAEAIKNASDATAKLQAQWTSPAFRQQTRQLAAARLEYDRTVTALQRINQQEAIRARVMDAQRRFGRAAGSVYGAGLALAGNPLVQGAWGLAQRGAQYAQGMAQRGFQGTAESARLGNEMTMLAREFAGVAKPVSDGLEKIARSARKAMEAMDGDQQKRLLYGTLAVGGGALALRYRGAIGSAMGGAASLTGLTGGGGVGMTVRRVLGRAGPIGAALNLGASAVGYGTTNAGQTNPYTQTFAEAYPELAKKFDGMNKEQLRDYWNRKKESMRPNLIKAFANTAGTNLLNSGRWLLNRVPIGERLKYRDEYSDYDQVKRELERRQAIGTREGRTQVSLPGGGFEEAGGGYFRLQASFGAKQSADNQESGGDSGVLGEIAKWVEKIAIKTTGEDVR